MNRDDAMDRNTSRQGFTLVELLVVMAIIATLMGIVIGIAGGVQTGAAEAKARAEIADLQLELEKYKEDEGLYPPAEGGSLGPSFFNWYDTRYPGTAYTTTDTKGSGNNRTPIDPWGNDYVYKYDSANSPFVYHLGSKGPDGREGTQEVDTTFGEGDDITNRD